MEPLERQHLDVKEYEASMCEAKPRPGRGGGLSLVYSDNGKRVSLSMSILNHLSNLDYVNISYGANSIAVANYLGELHTKYQLKKNGMIYNAELVRDLITRYNLDFSHRTSMSFPVFSVEEGELGKVVYINMMPSHEGNV